MTTDTATATLDVTTLLERSLAVFRERGMAKGLLLDEDGRVCARGAIMVALGAEPVRHMDGGWTIWHKNAAVVKPVERMLAEAAARVDSGRMSPHPFDALVEFNNHDATTQEEMERVFEAAITASLEAG